MKLGLTLNPNSFFFALLISSLRIFVLDLNIMDFDLLLINHFIYPLDRCKFSSSSQFIDFAGRIEKTKFSTH